MARLFFLFAVSVRWASMHRTNRGKIMIFFGPAPKRQKFTFISLSKNRIISADRVHFSQIGRTLPTRAQHSGHHDVGSLLVLPCCIGNRLLKMYVPWRAEMLQLPTRGARDKRAELQVVVKFPAYFVLLDNR